MNRILITGAAGFIGSHLTERCVELGHEVIAFVRYNSRNSWGWLDHSKHKNRIEIIAGDIRDYASVLSAMQGVDTVFHLAALIGIPYSYVSPIAYIKTNIEGTYNILQAGRTLGTGTIVLTSTSETYGSAQYAPIDEKHPLTAQSPYSASKIGADQMGISFHRAFGMPVKIVRPFNTYGPRQSARAFIPTVITQIMSGRKMLNLGNLHPTRDLTFVHDTVNGFIEIANSRETNGEVTNIGMNEEISMMDLANRIAILMDKKIEIKQAQERTRPDKSEVERLRCDNRKITRITNWSPHYDLDAGLSETIKWFGTYAEAYKSNIYNV